MNDQSQIINRASFIAAWCCILGREPEGEEFISNQLKLHEGKTIIEFAKELKSSREYINSINYYLETKDFKEDFNVIDGGDPSELCQRLWQNCKIGVINWHREFTYNIQRIFKDVVIINKESSAEEVVALELDILINHHDLNINKKYGNIKYIALNYWTVTRRHVKEWNEDPLCIGIIDFSMILKIRHPNIAKPIRLLKPKYNDLPIYKNTGTKVISLIQKYQQRFEECYKIALTITPYLYEGINDIEALADAKWVLHLRHRGFVCNAVMRALACGVPVIMDTETWVNGFFGAHVRHNDNAIVLPIEKIKEFLENCPEALYARIKNNCVNYAERDKKEKDLN